DPALGSRTDPGLRTRRSWPVPASSGAPVDDRALYAEMHYEPHHIAAPRRSQARGVSLPTLAPAAAPPGPARYRTETEGLKVPCSTFELPAPPESTRRPGGLRSFGGQVVAGVEPRLDLQHEQVAGQGGHAAGLLAVPGREGGARGEDAVAPLALRA